MDDLYQKIIDSYNENGSVKKTAEQTGTYPIKVRRVLITEGLWHSKTSDRIAELLNQGKTVAEIAEELVISEKNVQSYLPYTRGQYGSENRSSDAIRSEEYRERMQMAAKNQVTKTEAKSKKEETKRQEQQKLLEELRAEKERLVKEKTKMWDQIIAGIRTTPQALQLHLELEKEYMTDEEKEILQKYGRMQEGFTRDFIVPGRMTLHALHYAIMKAFGWQNSHLHSYIPYEDEFKSMTDGGKVKEWTRLVGMYFRFMSDDYEDIYWDDDYEEDMSIKSWLRSKYCGPYYYGGVGEYYLPAQMEVEIFKKEYPEIQKKTTNQGTWNVYFDGRCEEMQERLKIRDVLRVPSDQKTWDEWKAEKEKYLKEVEQGRKSAIRKYKNIVSEMDKTLEEASAHFDQNGKPLPDSEPYFRKVEMLDHELNDLCDEYDPKVVPALTALCYQYDYGDGWEIKITCTNAWFDRSTFARDENGGICYSRSGYTKEKELIEDAFGKQAEGEILEKLKEIIRKEKPVCIAWDGMNLIDDVGGIGGFCEFLEIINGNDPEKKKEYKDWAKWQGWTGRMPKPENIL